MTVLHCSHSGTEKSQNLEDFTYNDRLEGWYCLELLMSFKGGAALEVFNQIENCRKLLKFGKGLLSLSLFNLVVCRVDS